MAIDIGKFENTGIMLEFYIYRKNTSIYKHFHQTTGKVLKNPLHNCITCILFLNFFCRYLPDLPGSVQQVTGKLFLFGSFVLIEMLRKLEINTLAFYFSLW